MKQAQAMQKKMNEAQEKIGQIKVEGQAGGDMVKVTMNGKGEAVKIAIDPKIIDPNDPEMLEDLVIAALNDAKKKSDAAAADEMGKVAGGMGLPPGLKLPF